MKKKLDNRIRSLILSAIGNGHRGLVFVIGDKARDQVPIIHHLLAKETIGSRPSVLWCYKKELTLSSHRKKRMRQINKKIKSGKFNIDEEDPFDLFISSTEMRHCYYHETHSILGNTYGMCVLQDFEALTPNLLARTIETVQGGGLIIVLLQSVSSLKQLYTLTMDVHNRYRTEMHADIVPRFNERFILSISDCCAALCLDDQLNVLPITVHMQAASSIKTNELENQIDELQSLKSSMADTKPIGQLLDKCKTADQAKVLMRLLDVITDKRLDATCVVTAARGRGKSASLGLACAAALAFGYTNIFVTSPSPENLKTFFQFVITGFDALDWQEHSDYEIIQSTVKELNRAVVRINVIRDHRHMIQYIQPQDSSKLGQSELLIIDEAAAIPLPLVSNLLTAGDCLVFLSSTVNGYEGTGRSLSLKLLHKLRGKVAVEKDEATKGRRLVELSLDESIRYKADDPVENWLNKLLCLDASTIRSLNSGCPSPQQCSLYYVNRDTLFSYHSAAESFLQRIMAIYVSAHYRNTPNDLQMLADAPAHHLFVLTAPIKDASRLPAILVVIQLCLEGEISKKNIEHALKRGKRDSGDLIPWTISQQFDDSSFGTLRGVRIVRIATHPDYQGMGYGRRALQLLKEYYEFKHCGIDEITDENNFTMNNIYNDDGNESKEDALIPRKHLPPLLVQLHERKPEHLDWIGTAFGLSTQLLKFWKKSKFVPVYVRQTANDLTGEHSCIMLSVISPPTDDLQENLVQKHAWLSIYAHDFCRRFVNLLAYEFRSFTTELALCVLQLKFPAHLVAETQTELTHEQLREHVSDKDLRRLELYTQNLVDHHLVTDLLPPLARLYFLRRFTVNLSALQQAILLGIGLQNKRIEDLHEEFSDKNVSQLLALNSRCLSQILTFCNKVCETAIINEKPALQLDQPQTTNGVINVNIAKEALDEMNEAKKEFEERQKADRARLSIDDDELKRYLIKGSDKDWDEALIGAKASIKNVSIKSLNGQKRKPMQIPSQASKKIKHSKKKKH